jgi:hypothetical protein
MRYFWKNLLRRCVLVAVVLGAIGYLFAEAFLMLHRMNGGTPDPANDVVRWRTPLTMAGFGVGLLLVMELFAFAFKRKPVAPDVAGKPAAGETPVIDPVLHQSGQATP